MQTIVYRFYRFCLYYIIAWTKILGSKQNFFVGQPLKKRI